MSASPLSHALPVDPPPAGPAAPTAAGEIFDPEFYRSWYADLGGLSVAELRAHWHAHGPREGRAPNLPTLLQGMGLRLEDLPEDFDPDAYLRLNPDLAAGGMRNAVQLVVHYLTEGCNEGRACREPPVDPLDPAFYGTWYKDLSRMEPEVMRQHWRAHGRAEGRHPNFAALLASRGLDLSELPPGFDPVAYAETNPDLEPADTANDYRLQLHYLTRGRSEGRAWRFDWRFYLAYYEDLAKLTGAEAALAHWTKFGRVEHRFAGVEHLAARTVVDLPHFLSDRNLETVTRLNPGLAVGSLSEAAARALRQDRFGPIRFHDEARRDAELYFACGLASEIAGRRPAAEACFLVSNHFAPNAQAAEHLGNLALEQKNYPAAIQHYAFALRNDRDRRWPAYNHARCLLALEQVPAAAQALAETCERFPDFGLAERELHQCCEALWRRCSDTVDGHFALGERDAIRAQIGQTVLAIAELSRRSVCRAGVGRAVAAANNLTRVAIIGDAGLPQCVRYRITQKLDQLRAAGLTAAMAPWNDFAAAQRLLALHDVIIFYRVPAFPGVVRLIEQARALGKLVFFEIDDLLFDPSFPHPIETYGGSLPLMRYRDLVRGQALYEAAARLCDFGLGSTLPIAAALEQRVRRGKSFVHRNALDARLAPVVTRELTADKVIFYGSGTLAHNSDFIDEVLPSIERILAELPEARLVVVGYLELPGAFLERFACQFSRVAFISDTRAYEDLVAHASVNIAPLKPDPITDAKSEIKWIEAGVRGVPSIVSATRNYLDVVRDGVDALIAHAPTDWYAHLKLLLTDESRRRAIGQAARERILADYALERQGRNLVELFEAAEAARRT